MGKTLYLLHETSTGYVLLERGEVQEVGTDDVDVQASLQDLARFKKTVTLKSFAPFSNSEHALENINALTEGQVTQFLATFLTQKLPKGGKYELGVSDVKVGSAIQENLGINCVVNEHILEMQRLLRLHIEKLVPAMRAGDVATACRGLAHAYSRSKVKFNVNRADNMIIQAIAILDKLKKDINTFAMRVKEWYGWHYPELHKIVVDNEKYCKLVLVLQHKEKVKDEVLPSIVEIVNDEALAQKVLEGARVSMGGELSEVDMVNIQTFALRVSKLIELRDQSEEYLQSKIGSVSPNLGALMGNVITARLISHAGSLTNLAKYPASTLQILGAEKALFRALKARGNTPKYGLIFNTWAISKAKGKNKGRISRFLANKAAIASRIDCFGEERTQVFGEKLREQVDNRLDYYENQTKPLKNADVMAEALKLFRKELKKAAKRSKEDAEEDAPKAKKARGSPKATPKATPKASPAAPPADAEKKKKKKKKEKKEE
eukprot:Hpha_TRINITY_DN15360_c3_g5::TRINITY_DN15360_c3_g5_i1::g.90434::m.90434/K14564/NOP56; nucleolar protein 56